MTDYPAELRTLRQWVCWRHEKVNGRLTKVPHQPNGQKADASNPATWSSFAQVVTACANGKRFNGIGFVFAKSGDFTGIDLDHHRNTATGRLDEFAARYVQRLNSYTEVSQSGTGVHVIIRATIPSDTGRRDAKKGVEMYSHSRFFCMTGQHVEGTSLTIEARQQEVEAMFREIFPAKSKSGATPTKHTLALSDAELIERASQAKNGARFIALWRGDWNGAGYGSQSEADAALLSDLHFWTGGDKERSFRLFGQSGLNREKWAREDYRERTWAAIATGEVYSPKCKRGSAAGEYLGSGDEPESDTEEGQKPPKQSAATRLVKFADDFVFFHDSQSRPFVRLDVNGHVEVWPVNSAQFRNLLAQTFYKRTRKAINRNALADAITTLAGHACFDGPEEKVFLRVAPDGENILIDLCAADWRVIEVTADGWRILDNSPVAFIRTGAMQPLPVPVPAAQGSLDPLWELLNVTPAQRPLVAGALLNYFHPHGPYFVTDFVGEQGSAKSCGAKIVRLLVDPNENPLRSPPREERDLLVQAGNNWCVALDNLSSLQPWQSDGLCRLSTGGGHSARQLYSDGEEFSLSVKRPVILNGIDDVATRPDLAERALQIELETIPDCRRMPEKALWRKFDVARPVIFSGLLNGLVCALRELPKLKLDSLPRMADAAQWATAGESAFGFSKGTFLSAYQKNLNEGAVASVEAHPVGLAIRQFFDRKTEWLGEPAQLLKALTENAGEELTHARHWPQNARALSACLRRLAPALRRSEINIEFARGRRREVRLSKPGNFASPASQGDGNDARDAKM